MLDLTKQKQAEAGLRESEKRFRDYVDVASDWFWEAGPDHRFTEFSRSAADWGLSPLSIGKTRWELAGDREEEPEKWRAGRSQVAAAPSEHKMRSLAASRIASANPSRVVR